MIGKIKQKLKQKRKLNNKGQAMVELALCAPMIMIPIMLMGYYFTETYCNKIVAQSAATAACRAAIVEDNKADAEKAAKKAIAPILQCAVKTKTHVTDKDFHTEGKDITQKINGTMNGGPGKESEGDAGFAGRAYIKIPKFENGNHITTNVQLVSDGMVGTVGWMNNAGINIGLNIQEANMVMAIEGCADVAKNTEKNENDDDDDGK